MSGARAKSNLMRGRRATVALCLAAALIVASAANAQDIPPPWPVRGKLLGEEDNKATNISGIACAAAAGFPRKCLVVDDETQGTQIAILKDGEIVAGEFIRLITARFKDKGRKKKKPLELDAEAVAFADGHFYVIGSHGRPRDNTMSEAKVAARRKANSHVFRLRIDPATISDGGTLTAAVQVKEFEGTHTHHRSRTAPEGVFRRATGQEWSDDRGCRRQQWTALRRIAWSVAQ